MQHISPGLYRSTTAVLLWGYRHTITLIAALTPAADHAIPVGAYTRVDGRQVVGS